MPCCGPGEAPVPPLMLAELLQPPLHQQKIPRWVGRSRSLLSPAYPPALHPAPLCSAGEGCIFLLFFCSVCMMPEQHELVHGCFSMSPHRPGNDDEDVCMLPRLSLGSELLRTDAWQQVPWFRRGRQCFLEQVNSHRSFIFESTRTHNVLLKPTYSVFHQSENLLLFGKK